MVSSTVDSPHGTIVMKKRPALSALLLILLAAAVSWLAVPWLQHTSFGQGETKSVNDHAYFFRLTAKYMHGNEPVDFDIVIGCAVRVTVYGDESSSYDAFRDPLFFVKA